MATTIGSEQKQHQHLPQNSSPTPFVDIDIGIDMGNGENHGDALQPPALHLRWKNITKKVDTKPEDRASAILRSSRISRVTPNRHRKDSNSLSKTTTRVILNNVSGEARPGEILALMGPSGSGKTSLMNVLSGRAAFQEGAVTLNGMILDKAAMKKELLPRVAYVKQQDVFFETLTVREQLTYTARLRFPENLAWEERTKTIQKKVERILEQLKLTNIADSPIGMCSGGEKKRVNIGTELLTDPAIILLDEPTSGLDSASAVSLLGILSDLARKQGKTILTSIHQPNSATFLNTFDKLMMLSDGNAVYFGTPTDSLGYLRRHHLACPEGYNAADHWMDLLVSDSFVRKGGNNGNGCDRDNSNSTGRSPRFYLQLAWDNDAVAEQMNLTSILHPQGGTNEGDASALNKATGERRISAGSKYTTSWSTQFVTLTHRALAKNKSTLFSPIHILKTIATGVAVGIVYWNQSYTEKDVFNIYAYFFFTMLYWVMNGMFEALFAFPQERTIVLKERATASYRLSAYFAATTIADLPLFLFMPFTFLVISYWMAVPSLGFVTFLGILSIALLSVVTGQGMGQLVGAAFDDIKVGQAVATVGVLFLMLLGGFMAQNIPPWLSWVKYLSPFSYASNAALKLIFRSPIPCDGTGAMSPVCTPGNAIGSIDPEVIFGQYGVTLSLAANVACLLVCCIVPRGFAYYFLRKKKAGERE